MLEMREQMIKVLPRRIEYFKDQRCKGATQIIHHWAFKSFEDNLVPLCEIVLLNRFFMKSVAGVSKKKAVLKPVSTHMYRDATDEEFKKSQGVILLHDKERGVFVNVCRVDGSDGGDFESSLKKLEQKAGSDSSLFCRSYPNQRRIRGMIGEAIGEYSDIDALVGVSLDPNANNDCLLREENGLFFWSERTLHCLEESKVTGELKQKKMKLVLSMIALFFNILFDRDENLSEGCLLETFIGSYNLVTYLHRIQV